LIIIIVEVSIELAHISMAKCFDLEFDEDMAFQYSMIKDKINKVIFISDQDALLSGLKAEALA